MTWLWGVFADQACADMMISANNHEPCVSDDDGEGQLVIVLQLTVNLIDAVQQCKTHGGISFSTTCRLT